MSGALRIVGGSVLVDDAFVEAAIDLDDWRIAAV
jgi:hypothetical protein